MIMQKLLLLSALLAASPPTVLAESTTLPAIAYQACADLQAGYASGQVIYPTP